MKAEQQELTEERHTMAAAQAIDALLVSTGPSDFCRHIVHADFVPEATRGFQLFYLDNKSTLRPIASYGVTLGPGTEISAWDDSPLSEAIREKRIRTGVIGINGSELMVLAIPFVSNGVPTGLGALIVDDLNMKVEFSEGMGLVFSKLGAFYLESLDFGNMSSGTGPITLSVEDLTSRQIVILGHIELGLVNLEIAKVLMLSESTIRQETVKIYRALGVGNRQEAAKKSKSLGLLPKSPPPRLFDSGVRLRKNPRDFSRGFFY